MLTPPEKFQTPPKKSRALPEKSQQPPLKISTSRTFVKPPPPNISQPPLENMSTITPPPSLFLLSTSFPSLFKNNLKTLGGGGLNPSPLKYALVCYPLKKCFPQNIELPLQNPGGVAVTPTSDPSPG